MEESMERWRYALEKRGASKRKTEYMCVNERETGGHERSTDSEGGTTTIMKT